MIGAQEIAPLSTPDPLVRGLPGPGVDDDADMYVLKVPSLRNDAALSRTNARLYPPGHPTRA